MSGLGHALRLHGAADYRARKAKGDRAEALVVRALCRPTRPWWLLRARYARRWQDARGIDVLVDTMDRGTLWLQVKSSAAGAKRFRRLHRGQPIGIVVVDTDELNTIYGRALGALILLREASTLAASCGRSTG